MRNEELERTNPFEVLVRFEAYAREGRRVAIIFDGLAESVKGYRNPLLGFSLRSGSHSPCERRNVSYVEPLTTAKRAAVL